MQLEEDKIIQKYQEDRISKIESSNLPDEQKKDRIELIQSEEYIRLKQLTVREVAPHQFEAY